MDVAQSALPETPLQTATDIVAATGLFSAEELKIFTQSLSGDPSLVINTLSQEIAAQQPQENHSVPQVYVNAKQYHCIMRRRAKRTRAAAKNQQLQRKPFLHESRHQHAQKRRRGPGGRFLTKEERAAAQSQCDEFDRENTDGVLLTASNVQNANGTDKHVSHQKMSAQTAPSISMLVDDTSQQPAECNAVKSGTLLQPQSGSLQTKASLSLR